MRSPALLMAGVAAAFCACSGAPPLETSPGARPAAAFAESWPELQRALEAGRGETLVDPELGIAVLDNPGAFVTVEHFTTYAHAIQRPAPMKLGECSLRPGKLPEFSCETEAWSIEGCILTEPTRPELSRRYQLYVQYALEPGTRVDPKLLQRLQRVEELATVTVTDTTRPLRLHFGEVRGRWRLLALDFVEPCSA
jgi:hypothetical protein